MSQHQLQLIVILYFKEIKEGLTNAIINWDILDLEYWYETAIKCNANFNESYLKYIKFQINLSKLIFNFDESMSKFEMETLTSLISESHEIKISGFNIVLFLEYAECTLNMVKLLQKKFESDKQKAKRLEKLIIKCEKNACDHLLLPKMRYQVLILKKLEEYKKNLREIVRLNILEDMEDAIIDATKIGFTNIKEYQIAKVKYIIIFLMSALLIIYYNILYVGMVRN